MHLVEVRDIGQWSVVTFSKKCLLWSVVRREFCHGIDHGLDAVEPGGDIKKGFWNGPDY
jgi:hypothetical protein